MRDWEPRGELPEGCVLRSICDVHALRSRDRFTFQGYTGERETNTQSGPCCLSVYSGAAHPVLPSTTEQCNHEWTVDTDHFLIDFRVKSVRLTAGTNGPIDQNLRFA